MFPCEENILQYVPRLAHPQCLGKTESSFSPLQSTFTDWNYSCALVWMVFTPSVPAVSTLSPFLWAEINRRGGKYLLVLAQGWLGHQSADQSVKISPEEKGLTKPKILWWAKSKPGRSVRFEGSYVDQEGIRWPHRAEDSKKCSEGCKYLVHQSLLYFSLARPLQLEKKHFCTPLPHWRDLPSAPVLLPGKGPGWAPGTAAFLSLPLPE